MGLKTNNSSHFKTPGPGNYNIDRNLGKIGYLFGLKTSASFSSIKHNPGPGAYSLRGSFQNIPGSKIGTSQRDDDFKRA